MAATQGEINPLIIVALFIPAFILMWCFVNFILYRMGWIHLQRKYHWPNPIIANKYGIISMRHKKVNYNNMLVVYADTHGFYIRPVLLFRMFSKAIFIPWKDVKEITKVDMKISNFLKLKIFMTSVNIGVNEIETLNFTRGSFKRVESVFRAHLKPAVFKNTDQAS